VVVYDITDPANPTFTHDVIGWTAGWGTRIAREGVWTNAATGKELLAVAAWNGGYRILDCTDMNAVT
jgi:hypothetical protein